MGVAAFHGQFAKRQHGIGAAQILQAAEYRGNQFAVLAVRQFTFLSGSDQQDALRLQAGYALQQQGLADLAGQVAALEQRRDGAAAGSIHRLGGRAQLAAFADGDDQGGGFQGFRTYAFYKEFHGKVSPGQRVGMARWSVYPRRRLRSDRSGESQDNAGYFRQAATAARQCCSRRLV
ncbi:hypothetical protein D9M71_487330 [compost metagenome]